MAHILVVTNMADDETGGTGRLSYDPAAAERVRQLLSGRSDVVEKKMVGGLSFLVNGNMCGGITGMALMVRVGAERREPGTARAARAADAVRRPGVVRLRMHRAGRLCG
jgi:hypothetical protein